MANTRSDGEKKTSEADDDLRTKTPISINLDHATDTPRNVALDQPVIALTESQRLQMAQRMNILRSPSRESVGTDISLFSVSTLASELTNRTKFLSLKTPSRSSILSRGSSPNFDVKQQKR